VHIGISTQSAQPDLAIGLSVAGSEDLAIVPVVFGQYVHSPPYAERVTLVPWANLSVRTAAPLAVHLLALRHPGSMRLKPGRWMGPTYELGPAWYGEESQTSSGTHQTLEMATPVMSLARAAGE